MNVPKGFVLLTQVGTNVDPSSLPILTDGTLEWYEPLFLNLLSTLLTPEGLSNFRAGRADIIISERWASVSQFKRIEAALIRPVTAEIEDV